MTTFRQGRACPINGGSSKTTISMVTFAWMCNSYQTARTKHGHSKYVVCEQCLGRDIPDEIIFNDLEKEMPNDKRTCEQCGMKKPLSMNNTKLVCSTCGVTRGSVKLRPDSVISAFREFHGGLDKFLNDEEKARVISIDGQTSAADASLGDVDILAKENKTLEDLVKHLSDGNAGLESALQEAEKMRCNLVDELSKSKYDQEALIEEIKQLTVTNENHNNTISDFIENTKKLEKSITALQKENDWYEQRMARESGLNEQPSSDAGLQSKLDAANAKIKEQASELEYMKKEASLIRAQANNQYDRGIIARLTMDIAEASIDGRLKVKKEGFTEMRKLSGF